MSVEVERAELLQEVRRRRPCLLRVTPRASARHGGRTPGMAEDEPDAGIASEDAIADGQVRSSCRVEQEFSRKRRDARHRGAGKCGWVDEYTLIAYSGPKTSTSRVVRSVGRDRHWSQAVVVSWRRRGRQRASG